MSSKIVRVLGGVFSLCFSLKLFGAGFLTFSFYDETGALIYSEQDLRIRVGLLPFPCIFHYNAGGDTSCRSDFRILDKPQEAIEAEMPSELVSFLQGQGLAQIQYFEAYCMPLLGNMNYFTHSWAMDKMVENRIVLVESGMFSPKNLSPIDGEIGVNTVVPQYMYFHDDNNLSSNVARFKIDNTSMLAEAWFVSIYDPKDNAGKNADCNQIKRAIVVHWYFIPTDWTSVEEDMKSIIDLWDWFDTTPSLFPPFTPQK